MAKKDLKEILKRVTNLNGAFSMLWTNGIKNFHVYKIKETDKCSIISLSNNDYVIIKVNRRIGSTHKTKEFTALHPLGTDNAYEFY